MSWPLTCPACGRALLVEADADSTATCIGCGTTYPRIDGVWRLWSSRPRLAQFVERYEAVRQAEGRGVDRPDRLPDAPATHTWQWSIRAKSYRAMLAALGTDVDRGGLAVVDLGAGVGWLALRLARKGHRVFAADVSAHPTLGIGALAQLDEAALQRVTLAQADFDHVPLAAGSADLVIYNAALHYSPDPEATLAEGLRLLAPGGRIVVVDSPLYAADEHGRRMRDERRLEYRKRYGFDSDAHGGQEYLTWNGLDEIGRELGIAWEVRRPWYGWRYALRPWVAKLKGRRPPSRFAVHLGRVTAGSGSSRVSGPTAAGHRV